MALQLDTMITATLHIPPTTDTPTDDLTRALFAWKTRHAQEIALTWRTAPADRTVRSPLIVIQLQPEALADLPSGVVVQSIPPLHPSWGVLAFTPPHSVDAQGHPVDGTKHFAPHTEVYCHGAHSGDGYQRIYVTGRHRATDRFITIIQPTKRLVDWQVASITNPIVLFELRQYGCGWEGFDRPAVESLIMEMRRRG